MQVTDETRRNVEKVVQRGYNVDKLDQTVGKFVEPTKIITVVPPIMYLDDVKKKAKKFDKTADAVKKAECCRKYKVHCTYLFIVR